MEDDIVAKNLLLGRTCDNCNFSSFQAGEQDICIHNAFTNTNDGKRMPEGTCIHWNQQLEEQLRQLGII